MVAHHHIDLAVMEYILGAVLVAALIVCALLYRFRQLRKRARNNNFLSAGIPLDDITNESICLYSIDDPLGTRVRSSVPKKRLDRTPT